MSEYDVAVEGVSSVVGEQGYIPSLLGHYYVWRQGEEHPMKSKKSEGRLKGFECSRMKW